MSDTEELELVWVPHVRPVPYNSTLPGRIRLFGYSVKESTGAATAELDIYNGADTTGLLAIPIPLAAGQAAEDWFGPQGLHLDVGILGHVASGSVTGSLFVSGY